MPNGMKPWEQTWFGRLLQPRVSGAEWQRLQQQVTPRTMAIAQTPEYQAQEEWRREMVTGGYTPAGMPPSPVEEARRAVEAVTAEPEAPSWIGEPARMPTEKAPEGYDWVWDSASMRYVMRPRARPTPVPEELSPWQEEQAKLAREAAAREQTLAQQRGTQAAWERTQAEQEWAWQQQQTEQEQTWREQQATTAEQQWKQQQQWQKQQWQEQLQWSQQQSQMQQQESERHERARLAASPLSWLQYASYTGEQPAVQKWMEPLMGGQYQAGQAIPGITPESMAGMPQLTTPSAQLWGRMGPTAQAGFAGYRQARTGIRPEETQFRMGAGAPPGGQAPGLRWTR